MATSCEFKAINFKAQFNVSQFKKTQKKKPYMMGLGFPVFCQKNRI
jgi:hypothetical protein